MLLHFIFVIKEEELDERKDEFEYVKQMAKFFQSWIKDIIVTCYKFKTSSLNQLPPFAHCRFPFVLEILFRD